MPIRIGSRQRLLGSLLIVALVGSIAFYAAFGYRTVCPGDGLWNGRQCVALDELVQGCRTLPKPHGNLCSAIVTKRAEFFAQYARARRLSRADQRSLARRVYAEANRTVGASAKYPAVPPNLLCKVRDNGTVDCVTLVALLAFYDQVTAQLILSDIDKLQSRLKHLAGATGALVACGDNGLWAGLEQKNLSTAPGTLASLDAEQQKTIVAACGAAKDSPDAGGTVAGGFSGITGIDPFGDACLKASATTSMEDFTEKAMAYADEMAKKCEVTLSQSLMEETGESTTPSNSSATTTSKEVVTNNACAIMCSHRDISHRDIFLEISLAQPLVNVGLCGSLCRPRRTRATSASASPAISIAISWRWRARAGRRVPCRLLAHEARFWALAGTISGTVPAAGRAWQTERGPHETCATRTCPTASQAWPTALSPL